MMCHIITGMQVVHVVKNSKNYIEIARVTFSDLNRLGNTTQQNVHEYKLFLPLLL